MRFLTFSKTEINDYYEPLIREETDYEQLCLIIQERYLALYCSNPNKLTIPDTLDQFYKCSSSMFEQFQSHRLRWIVSSIEDYWDLDVLKDLLVIDKTVNDLVDGKIEENKLTGDELVAYFEIQWLIIAASFSLAHYELSFKKVKVLKNHKPSNEMGKLIMSCLNLLKDDQNAYYPIQECYDTFNYTRLIELINVRRYDPVYTRGVKSFSFIIRRKMMIGYLNLTKQVPLEILSSQFAIPMEDLTHEISWLVIVLKLPFVINKGTVIWNEDSTNYTMDEINNLIDDNIIQGEALKTASLINLSFV